MAAPTAIARVCVIGQVAELFINNLSVDTAEVNAGGTFSLVGSAFGAAVAATGDVNTGVVIFDVQNGPVYSRSLAVDSQGKCST